MDFKAGPLPIKGTGHLSECGQSRTDGTNQDSYSLPAHAPAQLAANGWLFCVADGAGANAGDKRGSQIAVNLVQQVYYRDRARDRAQSLKYAVETANRKIFERSGGVLFNELSTSLVCALVSGRKLTVAHAGDCRAYVVRPDAIQRLTEDHVIIEEPDGTADADAGPPNAPPLKLLTRSVGGTPSIEVDCQTFALPRDARLVLCTQGLTNVVADDELHAIAGRAAPADAARRLVELAAARGSGEDITVVVVDPSLLPVAMPAPLPSRPPSPWPLRAGIAAALVAIAAMAVLSLGAFRPGVRAGGNPPATLFPPPTPTTSALLVEVATATPTAIATATASPTATDAPIVPPADTASSTPAPVDTTDATPVPILLPDIPPSAPTAEAPPADTAPDTPTPTAAPDEPRATNTPTPRPAPTATRTPTPTLRPVVQLRYAALRLREPQDNQVLTGPAATLEFEPLPLLYGDRFELYYRRVGNPTWDGTCAPVSNGACALNDERVQAKGYIEWTAVVVDTTGAIVSGVPPVRRFQWAASVEPTEPPPPSCIPQPTKRC